MQLEGANYYLKPMNCPMHDLIFRARGRSYRELPLRMFEFGTVYRYEKSGVVHGLTRVRGLTMDDAHIFCTQEQVADELRSLLTFVLDLLADYGLDDFYLELSTRNPEKSIGAGGGLGGRDRDPAVGGRGVRARAGARPGRRRVLRAEDLRAGPGRDRPDLADVDHPARLQAAGAVRAGVPGRGRVAAAAGDDPPGAVRLDRAVLRGADRALRRRVPGLAGAGAGGRHPGHRRARAVPVGVRRAAAGRGRPGRGGHLRRPDAEEDPHLDQAEGAVPADRRGRRRWRGHRVVPLPRRLPAQRRAAGPGGRGDPGDHPGPGERRPVGRPVRRGRGGRARRRRGYGGRARRGRGCRGRAGGGRAGGDRRGTGGEGRRRRDRRGGRTGADRPGRRRRAGRVRAAVDAAPDGLHQGRGQAGLGGRVPVLPGAEAVRRGRADPRPRRRWSTRCSTSTRTTPGT